MGIAGQSIFNALHFGLMYCEAIKSKERKKLWLIVNLSLHVCCLLWNQLLCRCTRMCMDNYHHM